MFLQTPCFQCWACSVALYLTNYCQCSLLNNTPCFFLLRELWNWRRNSLPSKFFHLPVNTFQSFHLSEFPSFKVSTFQSFHLSEFPSFRVSIFQSFHLSEFPSFRVSIFQSFHLSEFRSFRVSIFQNFQLSEFPSFRVSIFQYATFTISLSHHIAFNYIFFSEYCCRGLLFWLSNLVLTQIDSTLALLTHMSCLSICSECCLLQWAAQLPHSSPCQNRDQCTSIALVSPFNIEKGAFCYI